MVKPKPTNDVVMAFRVDDKTAARIRERAAADGRPAANYLRRIVIQALVARGQ